MYCTQKIKDDIYWVGASDRRLALFENAYPIPNGISYNSYLIKDEKTVLLDTVDKSVSMQFFDNIKHVLNGQPLDYLVINHIEPDHCACLAQLVEKYPTAKIISNAKVFTMISQFFDFDLTDKMVVVKEGESFTFGKHTLNFYMAPMVHWPEVMVSYDTTDKILFSADAFGTFGAINGNIFADKLNFENTCLDDARRYYTNIVGKYGPQVLSLLKKAQTLEIEMICPLHGPVWRENIAFYIDKYIKWASYTPEEKGVVIAYASIYGGTENACDILATKLAQKGVANIKMYDVSVTHFSYVLADCFKYDTIIFACPTYNAGIFTNMETLLHDIKAHNLQNRKLGFIENGSWAIQSGKMMKEVLAPLKNMTILESTVSLKSTLKEQQLEAIEQLSQQIVE